MTPLHETTKILSRHRTSEGTVIYARCSCGALEVWLESPRGTEELIATVGDHPDTTRALATAGTPT